MGDRRHQESGPTFEEFQQERQAARTSVSPVSIKAETTTEKSFNQYEDHLFSAQYEEYEYFEDEISNHETLSIIDVDISKNLVDPEGILILSLTIFIFIWSCIFQLRQFSSRLFLPLQPPLRL